MLRNPNCDFCGRPIEDLESGERHRFIEGKNHAAKTIESVVMCERCLNQTYHILFNHDEPLHTKSTVKSNRKTWNVSDVRKPATMPGRILSPEDIFDYLSKHIVGQDDFLRHLSVFGYEHMARLKALSEKQEPGAKKNLFVIGPTGCGKTFGVELLASYLDVPFVLIDATSLTAEGYVGQDVRDIARMLISSSADNVQKASCGIVAIDEVDKIVSRQSQSASVDIGGHSVQTALLKIIDSSRISRIPIPKNKSRKNDEQSFFDAANVSFIAMGAFSGLKGILTDEQCSIGFNKPHGQTDHEEISYRITRDEDVDSALVKFGMLPEFLGRFAGGRAILNPLGPQELKKILMSETGIFQKEIQRFEQEGLHLEITDRAAMVMSDMAFQQRRGARAVTFQFNELMLGLKFHHFGKSHNGENIRIGTDRNGKIKVTTTRNRKRNKEKTRISVG